MSVTNTAISLVLREDKGSALTHAELDGNQTELQKAIEEHGHDDFAVEDHDHDLFDETQNGLVPQAPDPVGTTKFLREDGAWEDPPGGVTYDVFDETQDGLVPHPDGYGNGLTVLHDDGEWKVPAYANGDGVPTGGIIRGAGATPGGYLHCNGAAVSKAGFSDLYAAIGDDFWEVYFNNGRPWRQQFNFNNEVNDPGDMSWSNVTGGSLATAIYNSQAIVTKNRVYLLGGATVGSTATNIVQTTTINSDGTLGTWSNVASSHYLTAARLGNQAITTKNRVYLLGGYLGSASNVVQTTTINLDGTLNTWTNVDSSHYLATPVQASQTIITNNRVYLLGGHTGAANNIVQVADFAGGENDYTDFTESNPLPDHFLVPDLTHEDKTIASGQIRSFIKY